MDGSAGVGYHRQERRDSHLIPHQSLPINGVHLTHWVVGFTFKVQVACCSPAPLILVRRFVLLAGLCGAAMLLGRAVFQRDGEIMLMFQKPNCQLGSIKHEEVVVLIKGYAMPRAHRAIH